MLKNVSSIIFVLWCMFFTISGCGEKYENISFLSSAIPAQKENCGPRVVFEPERSPVPVVPFPSDIMTRPDSSSPTGIRLNLPTDTPTYFEKAIRENLNELDGFSTFSPISLVLDAAPDVEKFYNLMNDGVIFNDPVILIKILKR